MRDRVVVKLSAHGNSHTVALCRPFRHALGLVLGDFISVELLQSENCIVIRKIQEPQTSIEAMVARRREHEATR